ncbi:hypothetical protein [Anaeromyxobacter sp. SG66]|uniref:hypothetical protein n=1 Tax=Anaeromyxobacter sp. SG66 TaxID=2925410 RepID=UPI001F593286|nr:hypothetical protein [Anaeromyxobacter sp. SG66]
MRRLRLRALTICTLVALAAPAGAAEITRVATSETGNLFDFHVSLRWDRTQLRGKLTREQGDPAANPPFGANADVDELRYTRITNALVPRFAVGLHRDLEVHVELPYVLADDHSWRFALVNGLPVEAVSTITNNTIDAMNQPCDPGGATCPLFPVGTNTTVYHGGRAGDVKAGVAWGIFSDARDDTKPFWLVGADLTFPTASAYDPAAGRSASWASPHVSSGNPGAFGEKVWKYDLYTVLSRRLGPIDPYFKAHVTGMQRSSGTYSNCEHAAELARRSPAEATLAGAANCSSWGDDARARLPWIGGLTFGAELVPYENPSEDQKVSVDVRAFADYTSSQRFYNPLTDMSGKLHATEPYLTMGGLFGLYLRASRFVSLHASASLATQTAHFLSGESLGRGGVADAGKDITGVTANPDLNPNYDWRYDAPGRRFRFSETSVFGLSVAGVLQF